MGLTALCLLLCVTGLTVKGAYGEEDDDEEYSWSLQRVPVVLVSHTEHLRTPVFGGKEKDDEREGGGRGERVVCGNKCQNALPSLNQAEQERMLGYETVYENGTRTQTEVTVQGLNVTTFAHTPRHRHTRRKRQVYGLDGRFVISDTHFATKYPFSAAVRLSTGCSGVLVSPKHVLTSAHCVHDGRDYLEGVPKLKVGVLQLKSNRGKGGRRRAGGRKGGGRRRKVKIEEEEGESEVAMQEGNDEGHRQGYRLGGRRGRRGRKREGEEASLIEGEFGGEGEEGGNREKQRGKRKRIRINRVRRGAEPQKTPKFRWSRVKQTHIPKGWILSAGASNSVAPDYDYALLELKRPIKQKYMELGVVPLNKPLPQGRIHFSGFDDDKDRSDGGTETVVYRFCSVTEESDDLLYQHCDAQQGAVGAGVYIRLRQEAEGSDRKPTGKWQRRVIGVFTGHQWVEEGGYQRDYNVAVRITPTKYAQICHWIHGDPSLCQQI